MSMKHMGWQKTLKHIQWMLYEQVGRILEVVLLILIKKVL